MRSKKKLDSFVDNLEVDFFFGLRMATIDIYIYILIWRSMTLWRSDTGGGSFNPVMTMMLMMTMMMMSHEFWSGLVTSTYCILRVIKLIECMNLCHATGCYRNVEGIIWIIIIHIESCASFAKNYEHHSILPRRRWLCVSTIFYQHLWVIPRCSMYGIFAYIYHINLSQT